MLLADTRPRAWFEGLYFTNINCAKEQFTYHSINIYEAANNYPTTWNVSHKLMSWVTQWQDAECTAAAPALRAEGGSISHARDRSEV